MKLDIKNGRVSGSYGWPSLPREEPTAWQWEKFLFDYNLSSEIAMKLLGEIGWAKEPREWWVKESVLLANKSYAMPHVPCGPDELRCSGFIRIREVLE